MHSLTTALRRLADTLRTDGHDTVSPSLRQHLKTYDA